MQDINSIGTSALDSAPARKDHLSTMEVDREADLIRLIPSGYQTVLDAGARDGQYSLILAEKFGFVVSLDLLPRPPVQHPRITTVEGDLTRLPYPDRSFDVVFCTEVIEHIPDVAKACREIVRVCRYEAIIGVPYRQDIRLGRLTCQTCKAQNAPWGHVNSFDERRLRKLFEPMVASTFSYVGQVQEKTNWLASWLMDLGENPWGTYNQETPCFRCGSKMSTPRKRSFLQRCCSGIGYQLEKLESTISQPHANWVHVVFRKPR